MPQTMPKSKHPTIALVGCSTKFNVHETLKPVLKLQPVLNTASRTYGQEAVFCGGQMEEKVKDSNNLLCFKVEPNKRSHSSQCVHT